MSKKTNLIYEACTRGTKQRSEEVYFGKDNPFASEITKHVGELRNIYNDYEKLIRKNITDKVLLARLAATCKKFETSIEKHFNVEKCAFGLMTDFNACAYPVCCDKQMVERHKKKIRFDKKFTYSLNDIMHTDKGYRFRDKSDKTLIVCLGMGFFKEDLSDREIAAVLFHEFGHCLQQILTSVECEFILRYRKATINIVEGYSGLMNKIFGHWFAGRGASVIYTPITTTVYAFLRYFNASNRIAYIHKRMKKNPTKYEQKGLTYINNHDSEFIEGMAMDRKELIGEIEKDRNDIFDDMTKEEEKNRKSSGVFAKIIGGIMSVFKGLGKCIYFTTYPIFQIASFSGLNFLLNGNFLRKERRYEQFADVMTYSYGFADEMAGGLMKDIVKSELLDLNRLNFILYVPLVNAYLVASQAFEMRCRLLMAGYPTGKDRMVGVYKAAEYELRTNTDLTKNQKAELEATIKNLKEEYESYQKISATKGRNFVLEFYYKLVSKSLEDNNACDIEKNVLSVIDKYFDDNEDRHNAVKEVEGVMAAASKSGITDSKDVDAATKLIAAAAAEGYLG